MATQTQYTCDVCGALKGEANHWYTLQIGADLMMVRTWRTGIMEAGPLHLCGEACLFKKISGRLGQSTFAARYQELLEVTR